MTAIIVKDSNGTPLSDGESVQIIEDLEVKGTSVRLRADAGALECNADTVKGLVLKTCLLKKA
jgi:protein PhnA